MILYAHRGMHRHHTENTEAAFDEAIRLGFRALELDLVRLKDGHIVLFHDDTLFRMFQIDERVCDLTLPEFQRVLPGLMTFDRFHKRYADSELQINFEIKDDAETLHRVRHKLLDFRQPIVSSFNWSVVNEALNLGFESGYLFSEIQQPEAALFPFRNNRLHLPYRGEEILAFSNSIQAYSEFDLYFYTVNKKQHLSALRTLSNFKGVFTDEAGLRRAPLLAG
ncbi:MAG: hypothetical protein CMN76_04950 [Spirochaetaceae bacterium]|nr:hypothetical protein [Spirochaetaceae bacterium]|tara:strand:- start:7159 stop:7827 length:669 start_codon:yes stop_codon:yes gene_type:complete